jgi:predicted nucleic acid-binding Zn finger protein
MSDLWLRLSEKKVLDEALRLEIEETFGNRGKKALTALDNRRIKKYLDFFVVQGRTADYIVEDDFCTCSDFMFRGRTCWHLLAVGIARETNTFRSIDSWYMDQWKNKV